MLTTSLLGAALNACLARCHESKIFSIETILAKVQTSRDRQCVVAQPDPQPILQKVQQTLENCRGLGRVRDSRNLSELQSQLWCELEEAQIASKRVIQEYLAQNGFAQQAAAICDSIAVSGTPALNLFSLPDPVCNGIREFWEKVNRAISRAQLSFQSGVTSAKKMRALRNQRNRGRQPRQGSKQYIRWLTIAGWLWALLQAKRITIYQLGRTLDEAGFELESVFPRTKKATQCRLFFESNEIGDREASKFRSFRDVIRLELSIKKPRRKPILPSGAPEETPWRLITKALQRAEHQSRRKGLLGPLSIDGFLRAFPEFDGVLNPLKNLPAQRYATKDKHRGGKLKAPKGTVPS